MMDNAMAEMPRSTEQKIGDVTELLRGNMGSIEEPEKEPEVTEEAETVDVEAEGIEPLEEEAEAVSDDEAEQVEETSDEKAEEDWDILALAEEIGISVEDVYNTPIKYGDGTGIEPVTLSVLKDFYAENRDGATALKEKLDALDKMGTEVQAANAAYQQYEPQARSAQERMTTLEQAWNTTDWDKLPEAEAKAYADQLRQAHQIAKVTHENATAMMEQSETQLESIKAAEMKAKQDAWQAEAQQSWPKILADNGWTSDAEARAGMQNYYDLLVEKGMTKEQAHGITDPVIFSILKDALSNKQAKSATVKRIKKVSRHVSGKKPVPQSVLKRRQQQAKLKRAKSGSQEDQISAVSDLLSSI